MSHHLLPPSMHHSRMLEVECSWHSDRDTGIKHQAKRMAQVSPRATHWERNPGQQKGPVKHSPTASRPSSQGPAQCPGVNFPPNHVASPREYANVTETSASRPATPQAGLPLLMREPCLGHPPPLAQVMPASIPHRVSVQPLLPGDAVPNTAEFWVLSEFLQPLGQDLLVSWTPSPPKGELSGVWLGTGQEAAEHAGPGVCWTSDAE